jgi:Putative stress-responsive transcriptional regulator
MPDGAEQSAQALWCHERIHNPTHPRRSASSAPSGRIVAGVAAGLGRYFGLNPAFFRLGFIVLTLLGGSGVLVYLAALLIMPEEGKEQSIAGDALAQRREHPWQIVGLGLAASRSPF